MQTEVMFSSEEDSWLTPEEFVNPLNEFAGEEGIGLDPAAHPDSLIKAKYACTGPDNGGADGLTTSWGGLGLVFGNFPYSKGLLPPFCDKAAEEMRLETEQILLLPARVETKWWGVLDKEFDGWLAWKGRMEFIDPYFKQKLETMGKIREAGIVKDFPVSGLVKGADVAGLVPDSLDCKIIRKFVVSKLLTFASDPTNKEAIDLVLTKSGKTRDMSKPNSAAFPSAVIYHGHRFDKFEAVFSKLGRMYIPKRRGNAA